MSIWKRQGGPKNAKQKIGERPVLIFKVENRVGGNVCEALLEPTHVALPPMLHLWGSKWVHLGTERSILERKGAKNDKHKIGGRPVLFLG